MSMLCIAYLESDNKNDRDPIEANIVMTTLQLTL